MDGRKIFDTSTNHLRLLLNPANGKTHSAIKSVKALLHGDLSPHFSRVIPGSLRIQRRKIALIGKFFIESQRLTNGDFHNSQTHQTRGSSASNVIRELLRASIIASGAVLRTGQFGIGFSRSSPYHPWIPPSKSLSRKQTQSLGNPLTV